MILNVLPVYFSQIELGKKTVEGRLAKAKYTSLKPGDVITFTEGNNFIKTVVNDTRLFVSFSSMLDFFGVQNCLPGIKTLEEGVCIYQTLSDDYRLLEMELGAFGIKFSLAHGLS